jgi:hypothetical protein
MTLTDDSTLKKIMKMMSNYWIVFGEVSTLIVCLVLVVSILSVSGFSTRPNPSTDIPIFTALSVFSIIAQLTILNFVYTRNVPFQRSILRIMYMAMVLTQLAIIIILVIILFEGNKVWTTNAAVLVVVISRKNFEHNEKYSITHQFGAGAAWENLALKASSRELAVHAMQGFDYERARADLQIPDNFDVMAMIAIGKRGPKDNLPPQLQEREQPNDRKPITEIVMEGYYKGGLKDK